ncbi:MAG: hypothetical protein CVT49_10200 [candidate division Zixibacteria bacterium HGW-Zixibacteria-1]|nr:MAG: hypothetical protein CVT49_10200 [candidate division Zixibacteria bacterium HGW-Zixibacteria-1]
MEDHLKRLYELVDEFKVGSNWKTYVDAFVFGCKIRNLAPRTLNVYAERLGYLIRYLEAKGIDIESITKQGIQDYLLSLIGNVSDETVNGRIRVYRRFFNYLEEEGLWDKPNPTHKIKMIKAEKRVKQVLSPEQIQTALQTLNKKTYEGLSGRQMWTSAAQNNKEPLIMKNIIIYSGRFSMIWGGILFFLALYRIIDDVIVKFPRFSGHGERILLL